MSTTARWDNDRLMITWYSSSYEDDAALWDDDTSLLIFEGNDETLVAKFPSKPTAEEALAKILSWQNGY